MMIPETGSYLELKRAVLELLPTRSVICYQIVRPDGVPIRSYVSMGSAIANLKQHILEGHSGLTVQPKWG